MLPPIKVWRAVFLDEGVAENADELLQLNVVTCPVCGHKAAMHALLVAIDRAGRRTVVLRSVNFVDEEAYQLSQDLLGEYADRIPVEELDAITIAQPS